MATCKGCGREITWEKTPSGKAHPFDAKPTLVKLADGTVRTGFVSHFATCPQAEQFSKSKKES